MAEAVETTPTLTVLYATETGNAEDLAVRIAHLAYRYHVSARVCNMADYDKLALVDETCVVFVVSTTGNGEFPATARTFWRFLLRKGLPGDILSDVTFATVGLGDSTYTRFCWAARMLNQRLKDLGAVEWLEAGEADEQHELGLDGDLLPWLDQLAERMANDLADPPGRTPLPSDTLLPPRVDVQVSATAPAEPLPKVPGTVSTTLKANVRMTDDSHFQDVRLLTFALPPDVPRPAYRAGDVACIMPGNDPQKVEHLLARLGWLKDADSALALHNRDPYRPFPPALAQEVQHGSLTLRRLLTWHLDPFSVPRRSFFAMLQHFSPTDHMEHRRLVEFLQPGDGTDDMYDYAQRVRRTMAEVLHEFKSVQIPVSYVMDVFPLMRERQYSIASGPSWYPDSIQLAVAVVQYKTRIQQPRQGIASTWLAHLEPGAQVPVRIQAGTLLAPAQPTTPILMIGPGTGISPLRSLVQERYAAQASGAVTVIAGCRYAAKDGLFFDEWKQLATSHSPEIPSLSTLTLQDQPRKDDAAAPAPLTLYVAASRDQPHKVYVQDVLREHGAEIWNLMHQQRGIAYLCGTSGKMPEQVRQAMIDVFVTHGHMNEDQAKRYMATLETEKRWQEECW